MVRIRSAVWDGTKVCPVTIECELFRGGLPQWVVTGLPRAAAAESKERVLSALRAIGVRPPRARLVTNFIPAELPKTGSSLDLPLALALLQLFGYGEFESIQAVGELGISGECLPCGRWLSLVEYLATEGKVWCSPPAHASELFVVRNREQLHLLSRLEKKMEPALVPSSNTDTLRYFLQDSRVKVPLLQHCSQELFHVLQVSAVGSFPLLLYGHPGSGKTTAQIGLSTLQPAVKEGGVHAWLEQDRALPIPATVVIEPDELPRSEARGTGTVVVCDELPYWKPKAREWLRQSLDEGGWTVLATANPCPCGWWGYPRCRCTDAQRAQWQKKLSGPLLDRFPLQYRVHDQDIVWWSEKNWLQARGQVERAQQFLSLEKQGEIRWNWSEVAQRLPDSVQRAVPENWSLRRRTQAGQLMLALSALDERAPVKEDLYAVEAWLPKEL